MESSTDFQSSPPAGDDIAISVVSTYDQLPQKCKPLAREQSSREWVPLAGIVLSTESNNAVQDLKCVALGTGMKCLPTSKMGIAQGTVLHDSHAEIIAVRAFNRFILDQCLLLAKHPSMTSPYVQRRSPEDVTATSPQPFAISKDVSIHMYGSEAPCGDASMELIMAAQEDATPWAVPSVSTVDNLSADSTPLKGRGSFGELGIVRRKPARPDAPNALSKSCTDKLTMYQYTSLLNSLTSLLVCPRHAYLSSLTIPTSQFVGPAITRAFTASGRLSTMDLKDKGEYAFEPFAVQTTNVEFTWSRRCVKDRKPIPSNISAVYTMTSTEVLINGVLQGRKLGDPKGASSICRKSLWKTAAELAAQLNDEGFRRVLMAESYQILKASDLLSRRRRVKREVKDIALLGWIPNMGDEGFNLQEGGL